MSTLMGEKHNGKEFGTEKMRGRMVGVVPKEVTEIFLRGLLGLGSNPETRYTHIIIMGMLPEEPDERMVKQIANENLLYDSRNSNLGSLTT